MASAESITRLYAQGKVTNLIKPEPEQVKTATVADSEPDLLALQMTEWQRPAPRCALQRRGPETRFSTPAMMGTMVPTSIPMGRADFGSMAMRDAAAEAVRAAVARQIARQAGRGGADAQPLPMLIQI